MCVKFDQTLCYKAQTTRDLPDFAIIGGFEMIALPVLDMSPSHRAVEIGPSLGPCCHRMMWTFEVALLKLMEWASKKPTNRINIRSFFNSKEEKGKF